MPLPVAALDPSCVWNPDLNVVAAHVLRGIDNTKHEMGGALYKDADGNYCYSVPVDSGAHDTINYKVKIPQGTSLAGIWHTHIRPDPNMPDDHFSPPDVKMADQLKLASFLRDMASPDIRRYDPGVSKQRLAGGTSNSVVSDGTLVNP